MYAEIYDLYGNFQDMTFAFKVFDVLIFSETLVGEGLHHFHSADIYSLLPVVVVFST